MAVPTLPSRWGVHTEQPDEATQALNGGSTGEQDNGGRGVFLTWQDVSVTAVDQKGGRVVILENIRGCARPGQVLALMGPSGSGKTTLLDALSGRLGADLNGTGDILINGRRERLCYGASAYVTQENTLMSTLTVREAVHYAAQLQLPASMPLAEKLARADRAIRDMGLWAVAGTRIGGRVSKGISGGERRRLSICMEVLASPGLLFLDEPTSGLDSAAALHVMRLIARLALADGITVVAAIHQPGTEVFELFQGLCLLANGRQVYFGPVLEAAEFFSANGFPCPSRRNPSDHYLTVINKDFDQEVEERSSLKSPSAAKAIETLVNSFRSVNIMPTNTPITRIQNDAYNGSSTVKGQCCFFTKLLVLIERSTVNMHRDIGYYWLRFGVFLFVCFCIGTVYYNVGGGFAITSVQDRISMIVCISTLLTVASLGGFMSFAEDMKVFRKERLNGHYGATAFVISNTLSSVPFLGLLSTVPIAVVYYMTGLQRGIDHFIYFVAVQWTSAMLVEGMMMIVAAVMTDLLNSVAVGAGIQGLLMLGAGFFRLPSDLPKLVWKYPIYFISYHKYVIQGLYKNEFLGLAFKNNLSFLGLAIENNLSHEEVIIGGDYVLKNILQVEMGYSKWVDLAMLCAMVVIYRTIFLVMLKVTEMGRPAIKWFFLRGINGEQKAHVLKLA
ncbi:hypothetical protein ACP70R_013767 [Stipagrostis hirtigluma subsp. patula]